MPEYLTSTHFEPRVQESFEITGSSISLVLVECKRLPSHPGQQREPFSLVFRGPRETLLEQRTYALQNQEMGSLEVFLVPIASEASGFLYEAVFN